MIFQKIVMIIAIIVLILVLIFIGLALYQAKRDKAWPPVVSECPDYWEAATSGTSGNQCVNVKNLGKASCPKKMDFTTKSWLGNEGLCNKIKWAKSCDLTWDGVTNISNPNC